MGPSRRQFLATALASGALIGAGLLTPRSVRASTADESRSPPLHELLKHPLLVRSFYRLPVSRRYAPIGAAGGNLRGFRWIDEQRQGAEWIVRGLAMGNQAWIALGWRQLDWGLAHQRPDGGFGSLDPDPFHSTSFFVEALARGCVLDPARASPRRVEGLSRAAQWLMTPAVERAGAERNQPYTHRRYILAAALGQSAVVAHDRAFARRAAQWAGEGIHLQRRDGTNPEKDGYDVGYQMGGVLMALRYLTVCDDPRLRARLRKMMRKAVVPELARQQPDGSIDATDSTGIPTEFGRRGQPKTIPYTEITQALVYGAQAVPEPSWLGPAERIILRQKWLKDSVSA